MKKENSAKKNNIFLRYLILSVSVWLCAVAASFFWNVSQESKFVEEMAAMQARTAYEEDVLYRLWSSFHGGVYVAKTKEVTPDLNLAKGIREVETTSGKRLVLLNPVYITRQIHELQKKELNIISHVASIDPVSKEDTPDKWEKGSLESILHGVKEVKSIELIDDQAYLRIMKPLVVRESCVSCHADYPVGAIKGGISVAVPMKPFWQVADQHHAIHLMGHIILLFLGLGGIGIAVNRVVNRIKERDHFEEELINSRDKQANIVHQLAITNNELETFAYTVSHDLRAPLRRIYSYIDLIKKEGKSSSQSRENKLIDRVSENVQELDKLVETLLRFSRLTRGTLNSKEVDLSFIVNSIVTELQQEQPDRMVEFVIEEKVIARGDAQLLRVVLENLISNAWKFTSKNKKARIQFGTTTSDSGAVTYFVKDNGIGFSAEDEDRLFTPFQRLHQDEDFEGEGIGLATVRRIIHRHGGRIWAESHQGEGATFYFSLG